VVLTFFPLRLEYIVVTTGPEYLALVVVFTPYSPEC
jgi:hypothetical protein